MGALVACDGACGGEGGDPEGSAGEGPWYRAEIEGELGPIPFHLRVPGPGEDGDAVVQNGSARLEVDHSWNGDWVNLEFRHWGTGIEAEKRDSGALVGAWRGSPVFDAFEAAFSAEPVAELDPGARFPGAEPPEVDAEGEWAASFDRVGDARLEFEEVAPGVVEGTIVQRQLSGGDFGRLAGNVRGDRLYLSAFDGQKAFGLEAEIAADGEMAGEWEYAGVWREEFTAVRRADGGDGGEGDVQRRYDRLADDIEIGDIPGLDDPRYEGQPVIVALFGTWCTTCGDHAPVLRDLYERYGDDGLEIHGVAYEGVDDEGFIEEQLSVYRERYGADWPIVPVPGPIDEVMPRALGDLDVLPITLFRDPDGSVRSIRAGFVSPASGEEYDAQVAEFDELARAITSAQE